MLVAMGHLALSQTKQHQVGIFLPLYLDSAFDASDNYRYGKGFPRQSISALEFFTGAEFALDSLNKEGKNMRVHVFDIRSSGQGVADLARNPLLDSLDLMIGAVSGQEYLQLAGLAHSRNTPFVSATYPNDGGVKNNPNVIIANPKLNTHLQAIYSYVVRNLGTGRIIYARRKNSADDRIADIFKSLNQSPGGGVLNMETLLLDDQPDPQAIAAKLDSVRQNVIICGSVDENFGRNLAVAVLTHTKTHAVNLVGMPTWESIRDLQKNEFRVLPIYYSNSFFNDGNAWSVSFEEAYRRKTYSKPSDMAYKGYELTWYFSRLLNSYDSSLLKHLEDNSINLLTDFDFRPVMWNKSSAGPDYFENKRVYILKRHNGTVSKMQ